MEEVQEEPTINTKEKIKELFENKKVELFKYIVDSSMVKKQRDEK